MRSTDLAALARALRTMPETRERVAEILENMAAEVAEAEAQPVPFGLRPPMAPEYRQH